MVKFKAKFFHAEEAMYYGASTLFVFEGFKFMEGTDAKDNPHYLVVDYNVDDPEKPVFYELHLEDFYNLIAKYLLGIQPGHEQAFVTLRNELDRMTGRKESFFKS